MASSGPRRQSGGRTMEAQGRGHTDVPEEVKSEEWGEIKSPLWRMREERGTNASARMPEGDDVPGCWGLGGPRWHGGTPHGVNSANWWRFTPLSLLSPSVISHRCLRKLQLTSSLTTLGYSHPSLQTTPPSRRPISLLSPSHSQLTAHRPSPLHSRARHDTPHSRNTSRAEGASVPRTDLTR